MGISEIYVDKIASRLVLNADSTNNFSYLLSHTDEEEAQQSVEADNSEKYEFHVADFRLTGGSVLLSDRLNVENFDYCLRDINVSARISQSINGMSFRSAAGSTTKVWSAYDGPVH